jgi:hypothetical protein
MHYGGVELQRRSRKHSPAPKALYETYDRILASIDEDDRRDALCLLQWLALSVGTLSPDEGVDVVATDPDTEDAPLFDRRRRLRDPRDILTICSSLVTFTFRGDSRMEGSLHDDGALFTEAGQIRLAHFSVRE